MSEDTNAEMFQVVVNGQGQYSIWPADKARPMGWESEGFTGTKSECLNHIAKVWTDMRPVEARG